jgi:NAD-reducing hydrogenase small subunit
MSLLDLDELLISLSEVADLVYGPLTDHKTYPEGVDVALVEGAVATREHLELLHQVRRRTRRVVSFGDCAVTGNVTALRNAFGSALPILDRVYADGAAALALGRSGLCPPLLDRVVPLHEVVRVDDFLPGCPPSAARIRAAIEDLAARRPIGDPQKVFG